MTLDLDIHPLPGRAEAAVNETLAKVNLTALLQIFRQGPKHPAHDPRFAPLLKPAMARLIGRIAVRQLRPVCPGP